MTGVGVHTSGSGSFFGQKGIERIVEVPGLSGLGIDYLDESVALSIGIDRHARDQSDRVLPIPADALEIPAFEIALVVASILEISWVAHRFLPPVFLSF